MAEIEGYAGQPMGRLDGGEVDAEAGDRQTAVGAADGVHGERLGIAREGLQAERQARRVLSLRARKA